MVSSLQGTHAPAIAQRERIFIAGHRGLVGSAIVRHLRRLGYLNLSCRTRAELDLTDARAVNAFFAEESPQVVILAAAKVGGILANAQSPADFLRDNLSIELNVIDAAWRYGASKLVFLASSCAYPKLAAQPIHEDALLTGLLEPTNEAYAIAKIAGIKLCQSYRAHYGWNAISVMPTNLYGPGDNFDEQTSHVLPALLRKFHAAKVSGRSEVVLWGTGTPRREFLHVDDLASAVVYLLEHCHEQELVNVGSGMDIPIAELAQLVGTITGFTGTITWDRTKPDGTPRKLLDTGKLRDLGWTPSISLPQGIAETYHWFLQNTAPTLVEA